MKRLFLLFLDVALMFNVSIGQIAPVQPSIMVIPSETQMDKLGCLSRINNQGVTIYNPDYRRAFIEDSDLKHVISKIGELFSDRGFNLKDLDYELRAIQQENAEDMALESRNGAGVSSSVLDNVLANARPDIILELTYEIKSVGGPMRFMYFDIQAKDAYTREQVGAASGPGPNTMETSVVKLAIEAINTHVGNLQSQMQSYFDGISANGRMIYARIQVFDDAGFDLEEEFGDNEDELGDIISHWMKKNSMNYSSRITKNTRNEIRFTVRIPLYDEEGLPMSAYEFSKQCASYLKSRYGIKSTNMTQGIGDARLVIKGRK